MTKPIGPIASNSAKRYFDVHSTPLNKDQRFLFGEILVIDDYSKCLMYWLLSNRFFLSACTCNAPLLFKNELVMWVQRAQYYF